MLRSLLCLSFLLLFTLGAAEAQKLAVRENDYVSWSATRRLMAEDFTLALKPGTNLRGSSGSFLFDINGNFYDLMGKRVNTVIRNRFFKPSSWLDTSTPENVAEYLVFQQTLFDIQEIYVRRLRQQARANAKRILLIGKPTLEQLLENSYKEAEQRRVQYTDDTNYATLPDQQAAWEQQIRKELLELQDYQAPEQ